MEADQEEDERLYFDDPEPKDADEDIEFQAFDDADRSVEEQDATTVCTATSNVQAPVLSVNASFLEAHVFCSSLSVHKCTSVPQVARDAAPLALLPRPSHAPLTVRCCICCSR